MVYCRKWLKGHVAPPPKSQFRGQGIHTAIICVHTVQNTVIQMMHNLLSCENTQCNSLSQVSQLEHVISLLTGLGLTFSPKDPLHIQGEITHE